MTIKEIRVMRERRKKRRTGPAILLALACCILLIPGSSAEDTAQAELPEWTVMFYFCGSDLESRYGYATENLKEIGNVRYPDSLMPYFSVKEGESSQRVAYGPVGQRDPDGRAAAMALFNLQHVQFRRREPQRL